MIGTGTGTGSTDGSATDAEADADVDDCQPGRTIKGTNSNNRLRGGRNSDPIRDLKGDDNLGGRACGDRINAGRGNDAAYGGGDKN